ncbi:uncharacterized protein [Haliotis cracherodii]|uniref:uncharacterized protein n=1 Tax=Haliotis cracherodii TaxID=6455 RepID=UPI0039E88690
MATGAEIKEPLAIGKAGSGQKTNQTEHGAEHGREITVDQVKSEPGGEPTADLKETEAWKTNASTQTNSSPGARPGPDTLRTEGSQPDAKSDSTLLNGDTTVTNRGPAADTPRSEKPRTDIHPKVPVLFICAMSITTGFAGGILGTLGTLYFAPAFVNVWNSSNSIPSATVAVDPQLLRKMSTTDTALEQCLARNVADQEKMKWLEANITVIRDDMLSNYSNVELKSYILDGRLEELRNKFLSKEWIFLILLMGIFEVAVMVAVWKMWSNFADILAPKLDRRGGGARREAPNGGPRPDNDIIRGDERTLNRVSRRHLENRVCVVGFHSETTNQHHAKIQAVLSENIAVEKHHVKGHEQILNLPLCKIYFVCVDFNERNVILEDPTKGLGDLRLTTVQAIQKMGGDVVLIYSKDGGSTSLPSGALYNSNLTSIKKHPDLRRLDNTQRMLSVFEKFTPSQIDRIVKIVKGHGM